MKSLAWISTHTCTGNTTLVVNIAAALAKQHFSVLVIKNGEDDFLFRWLGISQQELTHRPTGCKTSMGFDLAVRLPDELTEPYDYIFLDYGSDLEQLAVICQADYIFASTDLSPDDAFLLPDLNRRLGECTEGRKEMDWIVPTRCRTGEWATNTDTLFALLEHFDEAQIMDMIPE